MVSQGAPSVNSNGPALNIPLFSTLCLSQSSSQLPLSLRAVSQALAHNRSTSGTVLAPMPGSHLHIQSTRLPRRLHHKTKPPLRWVLPPRHTPPCFTRRAIAPSGLRMLRSADYITYTCFLPEAGGNRSISKKTQKESHPPSPVVLSFRRRLPLSTPSHRPS